MRRRWPSLFACALVLVAAAPQAGEEDPVVLTVGSIELRASEVSARLASVPKFQLRTFGDRPIEVRRRFLETALIPELLLSLEAKERKLDELDSVQTKIRETYRRLVQKDLRDETTEKSTPTNAEIQAYYDKNLTHFVTPERIHLWRILVEDEATAKKLIEGAQALDAPKKWNDLAREHSVDPATRMRGGNLGFVDETGKSNVPQLRVDPALVTAAKTVEDGEVVPVPVKEGKRYAVVWRRGTLQGVKRTLETEKPTISQILSRRKQLEQTQTLLEQLAKKHVKEKHPEHLKLLPQTQPEPAQSVRRPALPTAPSSPHPGPTRTPTGLR